MSMRIVEPMKPGERDVGWLQTPLQSAIELELSTLPPYLCGYWCLKDNSSYPATQLNNIYFPEMLHFGSAGKCDGNTTRGARRLPANSMLSLGWQRRLNTREISFQNRGSYLRFVRKTGIREV